MVEGSNSVSAADGLEISALLLFGYSRPTRPFTDAMSLSES